MTYVSQGVFDTSKGGHDEGYYEIRHCFMDWRGDAKISPLSYWGWGCKIITQSHVLQEGAFTPFVQNVSVIVDDYAWVTSFSILYKCHIGHHAIVSIGSVVNSMVVDPYTVVAGNPAKPVAYWDLQDHRWRKL